MMISPYPRETPAIKPRAVAMAALAIGVMAAAPFLQSLRGDFLLCEDRDTVVNNPALFSPARVDWGAVLTHFQNGYYEPVTMLSFAIDRTSFGMKSGAFRGVNLALHALCAMMVFWLAWRLASAFALTGGRKMVMAVIAGSLFALHPAGAQAVAWISARGELLATFFILAGGHFLLSAANLRQGKALAAGLAAIAAGLLAVLSSPSALCAAFLLPLFPLARRPFRKTHLILSVIGVLAISALCCLVLFFIVGQNSHATIASFLVSVPSGLYIYARNLLFPIGLHYPYSAGTAAGAGAQTWGGCLILAATIGVLAWSARRNLRVIWFGLAFAFLALLPNILFSNIQSPSFAADKYLYLAGVGISLTGGWILAKWLLWFNGKTYLAALPAVLAIFALYAVESTRLANRWATDSRFLTENLAANPLSPLLWKLEGQHLLAARGSPKAATPLEFSIDAGSDDPEVYLELAGQLGKNAQGGVYAPLFRAAVNGALSRQKYLWPDRRGDLFVLAARMSQGDQKTKAALEYASKALLEVPGRAEIRRSVRELLQEQIGRERLGTSERQFIASRRELADEFLAAVKLEKDRALKDLSAANLTAQGNKYMEAGKFENALECFRMAREKKPDDFEINIGFGWALAMSGSPDDAVKALRNYTRTVFKSGSRAHLKDVYYMIGRIYLYEGRCGDAEDYMKIAQAQLPKTAANPLDLEIGLVLAEALARQGKAKDAEQELQRLGNVYPNNPRVADVAARLRKVAGKSPESP